MTTETTTQTPVRTLSVTDIQKIIPHRYPFLLVDQIDILEEGKRAVGTKCVTVNEPFFQGHFPGLPIMPGVLIVEAMAQTCCAVVVSQGGLEGKIGLFMAIDGGKFRNPVTPGMVLKLKVEALKLGSKVCKFKGEAYVGDKLAAEAEMTFALVEKQ